MTIISTYLSDLELILASQPLVDEEADGVLYRELLDIHSAIEALATAIVRDRAVTGPIAFADSPYTVQTTDKLILVDTTAGAVDIVMLPCADNPGYDYEIKVTAGANNCFVNADGTEEIDNITTGFTLILLDALVLKNDGSNWWVNN